MSLEALKSQYVSKFEAGGSDKFYKFLLLCQINKLVLLNKGLYRGVSPEIEYLDYYDQFLILYRREGEERYLEIAKLFRKVSHKIYRIMRKKNMTAFNAKFLNSV